MEHKNCSVKVDKLVEKHTWITSEKRLFGNGGTDYDFESRDPHKAREELERLQTDQSRYVSKDSHRFNFATYIIFTLMQCNINGMCFIFLFCFFSLIK